ncbi:hypothetical protein HYH03_003441 [Edaphochlamys debaryana]|uniref:Uncharacterized protein n=1 Tax=Edaphochlamys debaryana TaxID=47281 RepID=A0A836C339_9CHLO|nr:hypothetical protein HYH03_003441 [Edaphochlamys debaryana]|eukprot:KAG2498701.1 hypothetical protein HYH03_003441 [Edaphochlamys debaryana]
MASTPFVLIVLALVAGSGTTAWAQRQWSEAAFSALGRAVRSPPRQHRPPPSHRAPASPAAIPCKFSPAVMDANGTVTATSRCFINSDFSKTLLDNVAKTGSLQARVDLQQNSYFEACRAYNFTTDPNAKQACRHDYKNRCNLWFTGDRCSSSANLYLPPREQYCPGSNFQKFSLCPTLYKEECSASLECVWSEVLLYGGAQNVEAKRDETEAREGGPLNYGACYWKPYADYMVLPDGTVRPANESRAWGDDNIGSTRSNQTQWEATRGTCDYAQRTWRTQQYTAACAAVNTVVNGRSRELNMTDYAALNMCEAAGCQVQWTNNYLSYSQGKNVSMSSFVCTPNFFYLNALKYDAAKDGKWFDAINACLSPAAQGSEDRCLGVRV